MSVINQMLQDLDERKPVLDRGGPLSGQVRVVVRRERVHSAWWAIVLLGMAMVIVGSLWFLQPRRGERRLRAPVIPVAVQPAEKSAATAVEVAAPLQAPATVGAATVEVPAKLPDQLISFGLKSTNWLDLSHAATVAPVPRPNASVTERTAAVVPALRAANSAAQTGATGAARSSPTASIVAPAPAGPASSTALIPIKETTPRQRADNDYGRALALMQEERTVEASELLATVLQQDPGNAAARQSQVSLLVGAKRYAEAERSLQEGLRLDRNQVALAMILARLQVEQGDTAAGLKTLQQSLPAGADRPEYQGFLAALLQREGRHRDAIEHYQQALRKVPQSGVWLTGMAISLQAENRQSEALDAFSRAQGSVGLSPELRLFVDQQLRQGGQR